MKPRNIRVNVCKYLPNACSSKPAGYAATLLGIMLVYILVYIHFSGFIYLYFSCVPFHLVTCTSIHRLKISIDILTSSVQVSEGGGWYGSDAEATLGHYFYVQNTCLLSQHFSALAVAPPPFHLIREGLLNEGL